LTPDSRTRVVSVGEFVELRPGPELLASPRYNDDIAPTRAAERTWTKWNVAALWVGMSICVPTYTLGGVLTSYFGLSVGEALWTILLANIIILVPLTLNAYAGTKYGIPFPVVLRSSFGIIGSNVPALIRAVTDRDPRVRDWCVRALGRIGPDAEEAVPVLIACLDDSDKLVKMSAVHALGRIGPAARAAIPKLQEMLTDEHPEIVSNVIHTLDAITDQ